MEYKNIIYERAEGTAKITINRPEVMNALNSDTVKELAHAFNAAKNDDGVKVVILTGSGEKAFIAGADINEIKASFEKGPNAAKEEFSLPGQGLLTNIERLGKPVIAAVNGYALGGGSELIQACHLVVAAENARIGQPEINLGFNPCWGGTVRLPRQVGRRMALEMILPTWSIPSTPAMILALIYSSRWCGQVRASINVPLVGSTTMKALLVSHLTFPFAWIRPIALEQVDVLHVGVKYT